MEFKKVRASVRDGFQIRFVARRTGLSTHVIRVWERRYGAVKPQRSSTGRRYYTELEIHRLDLLRRATQLGHTISEVARRTDDELEQMVAGNQINSGSGRGAKRVNTLLGDYLSRCLDAVDRLDAEALEQHLREASVDLSQVAMIEQLLMPMMTQIGDEWRRGEKRIAHEHLASAVVRTFLGTMRTAYKASDESPLILLTTLSGHHHEFGALAAWATALSEGWRASYLGPNLPVEEIAAAVRETGAKAVGLSITFPADESTTSSDLIRLRQLLGKETALLLGGQGARQIERFALELKANISGDLQEFREQLRLLQTSTQPALK